MPLDVINRSEDWLQIKDFEGDTGWVHQSMVMSDNPTVIAAYLGGAQAAA